MKVKCPLLGLQCGSTIMRSVAVLSVCTTVGSVASRAVDTKTEHMFLFLFVRSHLLQCSQAAACCRHTSVICEVVAKYYLFYLSNFVDMRWVKWLFTTVGHT